MGMKKYALLPLTAALILPLASCGSQDIKLTDNTVTYGSENFEQELLANVESEYTCKIAETDIDPNTIGDYTVTFVYLKNGEEKTQECKVSVADKTPPEISYLRPANEDSDIVYAFLNDQEDFISSIILTDDCDGETIGSSETVSVENVIFSAEGDNQATITCKDSAGNTATDHVTVRVIQSEIPLNDYLKDHIRLDHIRFCGTAGEISFRYETGSGGALDGEWLYLTKQRYTKAQSYGSGNNSARLSQTVSFDENQTITDVWNDSLFQTSSGATTAAKYKESWEKNSPKIGAPFNIPFCFSQLEQDPVIKELGGLKFFFGKTEDNIAPVTVDLKTNTIVK